MDKKLPDELEAPITELVDSRLAREYDKVKVRVKFFLFGLGALIVFVTGLGLLTELQLIRGLHDVAFPPMRKGQVAISYESVVNLQQQDPLKQYGTLTFYAEPGQEVKMYLKFIHQLTGALERRKVIVTIDGKPIDEGPIDDVTPDFNSITEYLKASSFVNAENVHSVSFALDDTQSPELTDMVTIHCIILVYEDAA